MGYNILHFAFCYFPVYGGMTTRLHNILSDGKNYHILYVPQAPNSYIPPEIKELPDEERFGNVLVKRSKFPERGSRNIPVIDYLGDMLFLHRFAMSFIQEARHEKVDIVYGHTPLPFGYAAMSFAKKNHLPFVYEAHAFVHDTAWRSTEKGIKGLYHRFFRSLLLSREKLIFEHSDAIIAQTDLIKHRIKAVYKVPENKISVVLNGVDINHFDPEQHKQDRRQLRKELDWEGKTVFLYSGLFDHINGIDFFLDALRQLPPKTTKNMIGAFLGRGPFQSDVETAANEFGHIEYLGRVPYRDMPSYYAASDVFVIPRPSCQAAETLMPMKLYEAMSMEKVVLVSDVKPMASAIDNGRLGILYPKENSNIFMQRIKHLADAHRKYDSIGEGARRKVISSHSWNHAHRSLQTIYDSLTNT